MLWCCAEFIFWQKLFLKVMCLHEKCAKDFAKYIFPNKMKFLYGWQKFICYSSSVRKLKTDIFSCIENFYKKCTQTKNRPLLRVILWYYSNFKAIPRYYLSLTIVAKLKTCISPQRCITSLFFSSLTPCVFPF